MCLDFMFMLVSPPTPRGLVLDEHAAVAVRQVAHVAEEVGPPVVRADEAEALALHPSSRQYYV